MAVKSKTNCHNCIDCQQMFDMRTGETSWRCYGSKQGGVEYKRDINVGDEPLRVSPRWCPNRLNKEVSNE